MSALIFVGVSLASLALVLLVGAVSVYIQSKSDNRETKFGVFFKRWAPNLWYLLPLLLFIFEWRTSVQVVLMLGAGALISIVFLAILIGFTIILLTPAMGVFWLYKRYVPENYTRWTESDAFSVLVMVGFVITFIFGLVVLEVQLTNLADWLDVGVNAVLGWIAG